MTTNTIPLGERFSHVYLERGTPTNDSDRMRRRLYVLFGSLKLDNGFAQRIEGKLGIKLPLGYGVLWERFFAQAELRDVLDAVTITWRYSQPSSLASKRWLNGVRRIFAEENVGYSIDDRAGVHFAVDEEFNRNRLSAIRTLESSRYGAALAAFNAAHTALDQTPPDTKLALRSTFEAIEILFRLMFPKAQRLGAGEIRSHLQPLVQSHLSNDATATRASLKMLAGFADWVDGVHFYRHGQGIEDPTQPPLSLAVLAVSTGASYLRWLGEIDQIKQPIV